MTIYNYVTIITSLSHFDHVFKMAETADEPDEYLSVVQSQTQKEKAGHVFTWFCLLVNQSLDFY